MDPIEEDNYKIPSGIWADGEPDYAYYDISGDIKKKNAKFTKSDLIFRKLREGHRTMWAILEDVHKGRTEGKTVQHSYENWETSYTCEMFLPTFISNTNELVLNAKKLIKEKAKNKDNKKYLIEVSIQNKVSNSNKPLVKLSRLKLTKNFIPDPNMPIATDRLPNPDMKIKKKWSYDIDVLEEYLRTGRGGDEYYWNCGEIIKNVCNC